MPISVEDLVNSPLVYYDLDLRTKEIRLLCLQSSADSNTPLCCTLEHHPLTEAPSYTALSYYWGDKGDTLPIIVGGSTARISRVLEGALRALCARGTKRVWADALCINQADDVEQAAQIQRMGSIYQCAEEVVAWLGTDNDIAERVFPLLKQVHDGRAVRKSIGSSLDFFKQAKKPSYIVAELGESESTFPLSHYTEDDWHAFNRFLHTPYWSRVWIMQEIAFGVEVLLMCGAEAIPFKYLEKTMEVLSIYGSGVGVTYQDQSFQAIQHIITMRKKISTSVAIPLMEVIARSSHARSSEIKDHLYGLFSMVLCLRSFRSLLPLVMD